MNYLFALGNQSFYNSNTMLSGRLGQMGNANLMARRSGAVQSSGMNRLNGNSTQMGMNRLTGTAAQTRMNPLTGTAAQTGTNPQAGTAAQTGMNPLTGTAAQTGMNPLTGTAAQTGMNPQAGASRQSGSNPQTGTFGMAQPAGTPSPVGMPGQPSMPGSSKAAQPQGSTAVQRQPDLDTYECQTCKSRKYQDGSNDPGVSFKTPTHVSPEAAPAAIRAHEMEHVAHARLKAEKEDQEIVSQSVTYHTSVCPECGRVYMAGGTTRTTFRSAPVTEKPPVEKGQYVDLLA